MHYAVDKKDGSTDYAHKFEVAGLGKAPFQVIGMVEKRGPITLANGSQIGAPGQPMGTCDFCGTGIANCFQIRSADGKTFIVGSDCVMKTGDKILINPIKIQANEAKKAATHKRQDEKIAAGMAKFEELKSDLASKPHPHEYHASQGKTLLDYYQFCLAGSGRTNTINILKRIGAL